VLSWTSLLAVAAASGLVVGFLAGRACAPVPDRSRVSKTAAWTLGVAAATLGAALRFAPEALLPFRIWIDTLYCIRLALRSPGGVAWIGGTWFGDDVPLGKIVAPNGYAAWADAVLALFGPGEPGLLALSALPSLAAILAAAWLAAELGGRESALAATILVSLTGWPIVHGRWGYTSVALVPLALAGGAALVRAARHESALWAAAGGALVGATAHTYPAAWPLLASLAPALLCAWAGNATGRRLLKAAGTGLVLSLAFVLPAWLGHPERVGGRAREVWIGAPVKDTGAPSLAGCAGIPARLLYNAYQYAALLAGNPDPNPRRRRRFSGGRPEHTARSDLPDGGDRPLGAGDRRVAEEPHRRPRRGRVRGHGARRDGSPRPPRAVGEGRPGGDRVPPCRTGRWPGPL